MKVIDLLNKIANGEEVPKRFKMYENNELTEFEFTGYTEDKYPKYRGVNKKDIYYFNSSWCFTIDELNKEVEIIEDTPKKKI